MAKKSVNRQSFPKSRRAEPRTQTGPGLEGEMTERGTWGQDLDPVFNTGTLLIPKAGREDPAETFSPAAAVRLSAQNISLAVRRPPKDTTRVLQKIGMDDIRQLRLILSPVSKRGIFAPLESLGVTAAFFNDKATLDDARGELDDEYEFVDDFALSIPCRVAMKDVPSHKRRLPPPNRLRSEIGDEAAIWSRLAPPEREWPECSGVAKAHKMGVRGAGALVGVLDTGIDADHGEFADQRVDYRYVSLQPNSPFWPPRDVRGFDTDGHGTHVSGIIAGRNVGVAPEVKLYVASVIESETIFTSLTRVAAGLNWIFREFTSPHNEHLPAVLSMSLGFPAALAGQDDARYQQKLNAMRLLLSTLIKANVLPIVAIGNEGAGKYGLPGAYDDVLGVGAIDFDGKIAPFSGSRSPKTGVRSKPDLVGYGVGVNSSLERDYDGCSIYQRLNGTSMATPYVAAIAALYRSRQPTLTVQDVWDKLLQDALSLKGGDVSRVGAGLARFV